VTDASLYGVSHTMSASMDYAGLQTQIDKILSESVDRILIRAYDQAGPCTYAQYLPVYRNTLIIYHRLNRWCCSNSAFNPPKHVIHYYDRVVSAHNINQYHERILTYIDDLRKKMYQQPCLICSVCQNRKKLWRKKP
jgi:hypothetical protein